MTQSFKTKRLVESALMIALSTILSFIIIFRLPFGGSITACCMLPVILAAYRYGTKWGLVTAFAFSLIRASRARGRTFARPLSAWKTASLTAGFFSGTRCGFLRHLLAGLHHRLHRAGLRRHLPQQDQK